MNQSKSNECKNSIQQTRCFESMKMQSTKSAASSEEKQRSCVLILNVLKKHIHTERHEE